jgi:hypothetical protein
MKQYLWTGMVVLLVNSYASDNPFDLNEDFAKLDKERETLLSELKRSAKVQEVTEDEVDLNQVVDETEKEQSTESSVQKKVEVEDTLKNETSTPKEIVKKLPDELDFFKKLIEVQTTGKHTPIEGELREVLEAVLKEKNNPNYTPDDIKKDFSDLKDKKEVGMMFMVYIMSKSIALQESMDSDEGKQYIAKFQKDAFDKNHMEEIFKKYPDESRELGFALLEDMLTNGIPHLDLHMEISGKVSTIPGESEPFKVKIDTKTKKDDTTGHVDINITREQQEAKIAADKAYEEAIREVDEVE